MALLIREEALKYLEEILHIQASEVPSMSDQSTSADVKISFLEKLIRSFLEHEPFQGLCLMSVDVNSRRRPTWEEIKRALLSGQGGLCYWLNAFMYALLTALGFNASLTFCTFDVGLDSLNNHLIVLVHDIVSSGSLHLVDAGVGYYIPRPISLDFTTYSPVYTDSFMTYRLWKESQSRICIQKRVEVEVPTESLGASVDKTMEAKDSENQTREATDNGNQTREATDNGHQTREATDNGHRTRETIDIENQTREAKDNENQTREATDNGHQTRKTIDIENQTTETINNENQTREATDNGHQTSEATDNENQTREATDIENQTRKTTDEEKQARETTKTDKQFVFKELYYFNPSVAIKGLEAFFSCFDVIFSDITQLSTHSSPRAMCWPNGRYLALVNGKLIQELEEGKLTKTTIIETATRPNPLFSILSNRNPSDASEQKASKELQNDAQGVNPLKENAADDKVKNTKEAGDCDRNTSTSNGTASETNSKDETEKGPKGESQGDNLDLKEDNEDELRDLEPLIKAYEQYFPRLPPQLVRAALKNWLLTGTMYATPQHLV